MEKRLKPSRVDRVVLVAGGKGGVGKTTVSVNLALALSRRARVVGLVDADIYGPNIPLTLGVSRTEEPRGRQEFWPLVRPEQEPQVQPLERYGLKVMSAGFLISDTKPVHVESSQMVGWLVESMLYIVDWGDVDPLIIAHGDSGLPLLIESESSPARSAFLQIGDEVLRRLNVAE